MPPVCWLIPGIFKHVEPPHGSYHLVCSTMSLVTRPSQPRWNICWRIAISSTSLHSRSSNPRSSTNPVSPNPLHTLFLFQPTGMRAHSSNSRRKMFVGAINLRNDHLILRTLKFYSYCLWILGSTHQGDSRGPRTERLIVIQDVSFQDSKSILESCFRNSNHLLPNVAILLPQCIALSLASMDKQLRRDYRHQKVKFRVRRSKLPTNIRSILCCAYHMMDT
jgi:hypothetical protein